MRAKANFYCQSAWSRPCLQIIDEKARHFKHLENLVPTHNLVFLYLKKVLLNGHFSFLAQIFINCFFMQSFCGFDENTERNMGEHHLAAVTTRGYRIAGKAGEVLSSRIS